MQLQEKTMVADTLAGLNGEMARYEQMIAETENKELKQTLKQFRNACEQSQEELFNIAREKSYYVPAAKATEEEVAHVRSLFSQASLQFDKDQGNPAADWERFEEGLLGNQQQCRGVENKTLRHFLYICGKAGS